MPPVPSARRSRSGLWAGVPRGGAVIEAIAIAQSDLTDAGSALESRKLVLVPPFQQAIGLPAKVNIYEILTAWRAADRALAGLEEDAPEWARVHARLVSLRASYHQLFAERVRLR